MARNLIILFFLLNTFNCLVVEAQAEYPEVIKKFVLINDKSKQIKASRVEKSIQVQVTNSREDTIHIDMYDRDGNLIKEYDFGQDTTKGPRKIIQENYTYEYDPTGKIIGKIDSTTPGKIIKTVIEYEDNGNISKEVVYSNDLLALEESFDYDNLARLTECSGKNYIGDCKFVLDYIYDSYNNLAKIKSRNDCETSAPGEISFMIRYDKHYNIISKNTIFPAGLSKVETFKYDNKNNLYESYESTTKDGYTEKSYSYDSLKHLARIDISNIIGENIIKYSRAMKYDTFGNPTEVQYLDSKNQQINTIKYYYEYYQ